MRGAAPPRDRSQLRTSSGKETLRGCNVKRNPDDVIVIDVECYTFPDVIIVDEPETWPKKLRGSSSSNAPRGDQRVPFEGVISIDDEDDVGPSGIGVDGCDSSKQSNYASVSGHSSIRQVPGRNCYGFDVESESGSSDSDCSDCELIDSSFDKFRELWEKASHNRRNGAHKARSVRVDQPNASGHHDDGEEIVGGENGTNRHQRAPDLSGLNHRKFEEGKQSTVFETNESDPANIASSSRSGSPKESDENTDRGSYRCESTEKGQPQHQQPPDLSGLSHGTFEKGKESAVFGTSDSDPANIAFSSRSESPKGSDENADHESYRCDETEKGQPQNQQTRDFSGLSNGKFEKGKQSTVFGNSESNPAHIASTSRSGSLYKESDENIDHESHRCEPTEKGQPIFETNGSNMRVAASNSKMGSPFVQSDHNGAHETQSGPAEKTESSMSSMPEVNEKDGFLEKEKPLSHAQYGDAVPSVHIINEREKLKETDEYKRAVEEEWASRQQELLIQAEEARRIKKRKKAETLRLLDMEKRQKQRVEEVRETQKKDEEHMNLKEQFRVEIRKELSRLEGTCKTMASLLQGLGIPVGGGILPTSSEVHAAYKRALLKFHPDRASRMDTRHQVEAEEKFKLIARMKEKFF